MRFVTPTAIRVFAWQNILAAAVFATLVAGDCIAFFLNLFPSSEMLWRVTIPLRRLTSPFSDALGDATASNPVIPFALLGAALALPLWAFSRRSLMTTAALGHTALAACVLMLSWTLQRSLRPQDVADLSFMYDPAVMNTSNVALALTALAMLFFCGLNHVIYIRQLMIAERIKS